MERRQSGRRRKSMEGIALDAIAILTIYVVGQATGMLIMATAIWAKGIRRKCDEADITGEED